jgi:tRNA(Ile)-lysidine synthase
MINDETKKVASFFKQQQLPLKGKKLLVAASGGPDSMALLDLLTELAKTEGCTICAAHLDHQLRADSFQESQVLQEYCQQKAISLFEAKWPKDQQPENGKGIEAAARNWRYAFLEKTDRKIGADYLLTAHHGDDLIENILIKFLRSGIPQEMNSLQAVSERGGIKLLRPLLNFEKAELLAYVQERQIPYVLDQTNLADETLRNRLRHHVLPLLKRENPKLVENANRFRQGMKQLTASAQAGLPEPELVPGLGWRLADSLPPELLGLHLSNFIAKKYHKRVQLDIQLLKQGKTQEKGGLTVQCYQKRWWLYPSRRPKPQPLRQLALNQPFAFQDRTYLLTDEPAGQLDQEQWTLTASLYLAPGQIHYGSLPAGQKLLLASGHHAKSKKEFAASGIPLALRGSCLSIFAGDEPAYVEYAYQKGPRSSQDRRVCLYLRKIAPRREK